MNNDRVDAAPRRPYYGDGRQPWDDIVVSGWATGFAAGNVLKYLRRPDKDPSPEARERDVYNARWYYAQLLDMHSRGEGPWSVALLNLHRILTTAELAVLNAPNLPDPSGLRKLNEEGVPGG